MPDRFSDHTIGLDSPATHGFAITPSDGADLREVTRAVYVGGAGAISLVLGSGAEIVVSGVPGGTMLPLRVRRLKASSTTATLIVGLV